MIHIFLAMLREPYLEAFYLYFLMIFEKSLKYQSSILDLLGLEKKFLDGLGPRVLIDCLL